MYKSIYFKIVLIFVIFMITVMAVVGTVLINNVSNYYSSEFTDGIENAMNEQGILEDLRGVMNGTDFSSTQKQILSAYSSALGIDTYRNFYILSKDGDMLQSSDEDAESPEITPNILSAMNGETGSRQIIGSGYSDYAFCLENGGNSCIIYILDTQEEMRELNWQLFSIIIQSLFFGIIISVILSFFLAKAITSPIQKLTNSAKKVASGEFSDDIVNPSNDEIGVLMSTFNNMKNALKNTLDEVSGERQKLETVFLYLNDSVIAFGDNGRIIHINESAKQLLSQYYDKNFNFNKFLSILSIGDAEKFVTENIKNQSYILRDVKLNSKALDLSLGNFKYIEGKCTHDGYLAVIHDITSRYELEKARSEFVANVSHELRTPLTVIKGSLDTLLSYEDLDNETRNEFLNSALDESNRMLRIVRDLLILTRLDNNKTQWKISKFDIEKTVSHLCDVMSEMVKLRGHTLIYNRSEIPLPEITADKERIEQVIINILTNAVKYTPDNGRIEITTAREDKYIKIAVKDNGIGIDKEDIPRLFERFYRADKSRTNDPTVATDTGGTGLGLAISKEMTEAHGGNIEILSEKGKGTTVVITLPIETKLKSTE